MEMEQIVMVKMEPGTMIRKHEVELRDIIFTVILIHLELLVILILITVEVVQPLEEDHGQHQVSGVAWPIIIQADQAMGHIGLTLVVEVVITYLQ